MEPSERQELASAIAVALANAPKPAPTATETFKGIIAITGSTVGLLAILVAATGWAFQLQAQLQVVGENVAQARAETSALTQKMDAVFADRWTRTQHDTWVEDEIKPLEARLRALETRQSRHDQ